MKHLTFRLKPGDLLKEEIEQRTENVSAGVLLSIVGGLESARLRMAGATPKDQPIKELAGPLEIVAGTGTFSRDGCHLHVAVSDREGNVFGGHLKDGCRVALTVEVVVGVFENVVYRRKLDQQTGFMELVVD